MAATSHHQLSVVEFLESKRFVNSVVVLLDEQDESGAQLAAPQRDRRLLENAVRVALLLARSYTYAHDLGGDEGDAYSYQNSSQVSSEVHLADYYIDFELLDIVDADETGNKGGESLSIITASGIHESSSLKLIMCRGQPQQISHSQAQETPMQILGRLFHVVFTQALRLPDALASQSLVRLSSQGDFSVSGSSFASCSAYSTGTANIEFCNERSSRRTRTVEETFFTALVDTKAFPIYICRFLADMMDSGRGGRGGAGSPFTSFQDVIQDLEQMVYHPQIFLHDFDSAHQQRDHLKFDNVHCGRDEETLAIMTIADQMEQSLEGELNEKKSAPSGNGAPVPPGIEAVFITGTAGSGKSHLAHAVIETLTSLGWVVLKAKFDQRCQHHSGGVVSSMFDQAVLYVVNMRESGDPDKVAYSEQVSKSILNSIGRDVVRGLMQWLPSLSLLFKDVGNVEDTGRLGKDQLIYPLSSILEAILEPGRFMMIYCDDLQFADQVSLTLLGEVLVNLGGIKQVSCRCIFLGSLRDDEVDDDHPFAIQYSYLQMSSYVNTTEKKLSGLSKDSIVGMLMQVFRLPRRLVVGLADVVLKKTAGHALFVREFLHSLLQDSIITYSSERLRYTWDLDRIDFVPTNKNVAELIAANLKIFSEESKRVLQILSLFGIQTDMSLLQVLETYQEGIISSLEGFIEMGILDQAGPIVVFTHDLILQSLYDGLPPAERISLHYDIGIHLGKVATSRSQSPIDVESNDFGHHQNEPTFFTGNRITSSILALACDQINIARDYISDDCEKIVFAQWNFSSGEIMMHACDFSAALYYFNGGISFLAEDGSNWQTDRKLSMDLYHGAVSAAYLLTNLGTCDKVTPYKDMIQKHISLDERLDSHIVILQSMLLTLEYKEGMAICVDIFKHFNFHIPYGAIAEETSSMTRSSADQVRSIGQVPSWRTSADEIASQRSVDDVVKLCGKFRNERSRDIIKVFDIFLDYAYAMGTLLFPVMVHEAVKYSLTHGVSQESASIFALYAMMKIRLDGDYEGCKKWTNITRAVLKEFRARNQALRAAEIRSLTWLACFVEIHWTPSREISEKLHSFSKESQKIGDKVMALFCKSEALLIELHGNEKLPLISNQLATTIIFQEFYTILGSQKTLNLMKYSKRVMKIGCSEWILLYELMGYSKEYLSSCGVSSMDELQLEDEFRDDNFLLFRYHVYCLLRAYWRGDPEAAEQYSSNALSNPASKFTSVSLDCSLTLFGGLVSFGLYRKLGGKERLQQGRRLLAKMEELAQNAMDVFGDKWFLLQAEHEFAVIGKSDETEKLYKAGIKAARDSGNIRELALSYELLGNYFDDIGGLREDSSDCFCRAHVYYSQWGAAAKASQLQKDHNLVILPEILSSAKRDRDGNDC